MVEELEGLPPFEPKDQGVVVFGFYPLAHDKLTSDELGVKALDLPLEAELCQYLEITFY